MDTLIESYEHNGAKIDIHYDEDTSSPREDDNIGMLVIFEGGNHMGINETDHNYDPDDYAGWDEMEAAVLKDYPGAELLPVYRYEHSQVAYSTKSFVGRAQHAEWDSGRVGFILVPREKMLEEYGTTRCTKAIRAKTRTYIEGEVETYSQWANGEVYGYIIKDEDGEEIDSCWGFYGIDYCKEEAERCC